MRMRTFTVVLTLLLTATGTGGAQVAWDAPLLVPPRPEGGIGLFLVDPARGDLGVMGTWRSGGRPTALGFRVGLAEDRADDVSLFGGVDVSGSLTRATADFPLDIAWVGGAGLGVADDLLVSFPLGLSVGHTFVGEGVRFTPYLLPRVILDAAFGEDQFGEDRSDLDLEFAVDLGIDLGFQPRWLIRFGGTLGDREALAIGIVFPR